jgi:hypothetical protein
MRMPMRLILLSIWVGLLFSCGASSQYGIEDSASEKLAQMKIDLVLEFSDAASMRTCSIKDGRMICAGMQRIPPAVMTSKPYVDFESELPEPVPSIVNYQYYGPYGISPEGSLAVYSIARKDLISPYATSFILLERKTGKIMFQRHEDPSPQIEYLVSDIAWSPDSKHFVLLEYVGDRDKSLVGTISFALGHRIDICTFFVSIYDLKGVLLTRFKVASGLANATGRVFWNAGGRLGT